MAGLGEVLVNQLMLMCDIREFKQESAKLNISISSAPAPSKCKEIMVCEFADRLTQIKELLNLYKLLVRKDCNDISNATQKLTDVDQKSAAIWAAIEAANAAKGAVERTHGGGGKKI